MTRLARLYGFLGLRSREERMAWASSVISVGLAAITLGLLLWMG